ncbi:hypothetical protein OG298_02635 [Streptomyces sp. NBC_01005]|uniref:hypothetical protein n=1 Tax=unclassified Streptomyces TaxID=2593676 RepID=UPI002E382435|nr:hypothetical protein [Streptomyces sp. NBC_01362]WSW03329.1 hypothetical protein OG298_02635 [Streptomyces sp. NBC_01005]WTC92831.1 hypothetical protein OH736_02620 [Streptomyces sp. NBC_01650]
MTLILRDGAPYVGAEKVEQLASRILASGLRRVYVRRAEDGWIVGAGGKDQEQDDTQAATEAAPLHFSSSRDAGRPRERVCGFDEIVGAERTGAGVEGTEVASAVGTPAPAAGAQQDPPTTACNARAARAVTDRAAPAASCE